MRSGAVAIARLHPEDVMAIVPQASQRFTLGIDTRSVSEDEAEDLAASPEAWAVRRGGALIACIGIRESFPGAQGVAWATLAEGIGTAHLAMTRFARERIARCGLARVEAIVPAYDAETIIDHYPGVASDGQVLLEAVLSVPTPEVTWARLVGLRPAHVLRKFGAAAQTHVLFERIA